MENKNDNKVYLRYKYYDINSWERHFVFIPTKYDKNKFKTDENIFGKNMFLYVDKVREVKSDFIELSARTFYFKDGCYHIIKKPKKVILKLSYFNEVNPFLVFSKGELLDSLIKERDKYLLNLKKEYLNSNRKLIQMNNKSFGIYSLDSRDVKLNNINIFYAVTYYPFVVESFHEPSKNCYYIKYSNSLYSKNGFITVDRHYTYDDMVFDKTYHKKMKVFPLNLYIYKLVTFNKKRLDILINAKVWQYKKVIDLVKSV